jgi:fructose transport system substrate-binding protein
MFDVPQAAMRAVALPFRRICMDLHMDLQLNEASPCAVVNGRTRATMVRAMLRATVRAMVAVALVDATVACARPPALAAQTVSQGVKPTAASKPVIGLITKTETNPFFVKMKEGAQEAAAARGARLLTGAGKNDGDNAGQVTAMENMIAAGAQVILITVSDAKAIVPAIKRARSKGVLVIALDSPTDPLTTTDALFATNNYAAGQLIGQYARRALGNTVPQIATLDLLPGHPVGAQRHNGFLQGFGLTAPEASVNTLGKPAEVVCMVDSYGDQAKGQTGMENCLQKNPGINVVYTINEPTAAGAYKALKAAGKEKGVVLVSVDGGCQGVRDVGTGAISATAQQYPLKMASLGVNAGVDFVQTGKRPTGYTDTGVTLIAAKALPGVDSKDVKTGLALCFGRK